MLTSMAFVLSLIVAGIATTLAAPSSTGTSDVDHPWLPKARERRTGLPTNTRGRRFLQSTGLEACEREATFRNDGGLYDCTCDELVEGGEAVLECAELDCQRCDADLDVCGVGTELATFSPLGQEVAYQFLFQYNSSERTEEILIEESDCVDFICSSCRVAVDGVNCTSCEYCDSDSFYWEVDCENVEAGARFNECDESSMIFSSGIFQVFSEDGFFECLPLDLTPAGNDLCPDAIPISGGDLITGDLFIATPDFDVVPSCVYNVGDIGVWYSLVGTGNTIHLSTCSEATNFDAIISVFEGVDECTDLRCVDQVEAFFNFDCQESFYAYTTSWLSVAGANYTVFVSHYVGDFTGTYQMTVTEVSFDDNDSCEGATEILQLDGSLIPGTTALASGELPFDPCFPSSRTPGLWYSVTGDGSTIRATTCTFLTDYDSTISVYAGTCGALTCVGTADLTAGCYGGGTQFEFPTTDQEVYYVLVHGEYGSAIGTFGLSLLQFVPVGNDECDGASLLETSMLGSTEMATTDDVSFASCSVFTDSAGVWYSVTGMEGGVRVSTCSNATNFDTAIEVFSGSCSFLDCVGSNFDDWSCDNSRHSTYSWIADANTTYFVLVYGELFGVSSGDFEISLSSFVPPINDDCSGAVGIELNTTGEVVVTVEGSTLDATEEVTDVPYCGDINQGVWYVVEGNGKFIEATTCTQNFFFDAEISIFSGSCDQLECLTYSTQYYFCEGSGSGSKISWYVEEGTTYHLFIKSSYFGDGGTFELTLREIETATNDRCPNPVPVPSNGTQVVGDTTDATFDDVSGNPCFDFVSNGPGLWFSVIGTGSTLLASSCSSATTSQVYLSVYTGPCDSLTCHAEGFEQECISAGYSGEVSFPTETDVEYLILVQGDGYSLGTFGLSVTELVPPENSFCSNATAVEFFDGRVILGSTLVAAIDDEAGFTGNGFCREDPGPSLWYSVIGNASRSLTASTCGKDTDHDTVLEVFSGTCEALDCIDDGDDECRDGGQVAWTADAGTQYYIRVRGFGFVRGNFGLKVQELDSPSNDKCQDAALLTKLDGSVILGTTELAFSDPDAESCFLSSESPGVWYTVTGSGNTFRASTCSFLTRYSTAMAVFSGTCVSLECIAAEDTFSSGCSDGGTTIEWSSTLGEVYYILVYGAFDSGDGDFGVSIEQFVPASNDMCQGALPLETSVVGSTIAATIDDLSTNFCSLFPDAPGLWYQLEDLSGGIQLSTCSAMTDYDTELYVFSGSCESLNCVGGGKDDANCHANPSTSSVSWIAEANTTYYVLVYGSSFNHRFVGNFELTVGKFNPPPNDDCSGAISIELGSAVNGSTTDASLEADNVAYCDGQDPGVWYHLTGSGTPVTAYTCTKEEAYYAFFSVYSGTCDQLQCISGALQDDSCGYSGSRSTFFAEDGVDYFLLVQKLFDGVSGSFNLTVEEAQTAPNDLCENPELIPADGAQVIGVLANATADIVSAESCSFFYDGNGLWYRVLGTGKGIRVSTCSSLTTTDVALHAFSGSCSNLTCIGEEGQSQCNFGGFADEITWQSELGVEYLVLAQGFSQFSAGTFTLSVSEFELPPNDLCTNATTIESFDGDVIVGSLLLATVDESVESAGFGSCSSFPRADLWYKFNASTSMGFRATTCGSETNFDTVLEIFSGSCDALQCVAADDDSECGSASTVNFAANAGIEYFIHVRGFAGVRGDFGLRVFGLETPPNDLCEGAVPFTELDGSVVSGSTDLATSDVDVDTCFASDSPGVWFNLTGTGDFLLASTCSSSTTYSSALVVYSGSCGALECIGLADTFNSGCVDGANFGWYTIPGETYYILVNGAFSGNAGGFGLSIEPSSPPENDMCVNATVIGKPDGTVFEGSIEFATTSTVDLGSGFCGFLPGPDVWFTLSSDMDQSLTASLCGGSTNYDSRLSVFSGTCDSLVCIGDNDDGESCFSLASEVTWNALNATDYYIRVHGFGSNRGDYGLTVTPTEEDVQE